MWLSSSSTEMTVRHMASHMYANSSLEYFFIGPVSKVENK
jgi:hypothetical protein